MFVKNMRNVIVDTGQIDLPFFFSSMENKLSSLADVTIARPRIANEIHQLYEEQQQQSSSSSMLVLVEQRRRKKKKMSVLASVRRMLDIYLEEKRRRRKKKKNKKKKKPEARGEKKHTHIFLYSLLQLRRKEKKKKKSLWSLNKKKKLVTKSLLNACIYCFIFFSQFSFIHSFVCVLDNYNLIVQTSNLLLLLTYGKISHPYAR